MTLLSRVFDHPIAPLALGFAALSALIWWNAQPSREQIVAADGGAAWLIECNAPGECLSEASAACPRGYETISRQEERGQAAPTYLRVGETMVPMGSGESFVGAMVVRCKP